MIPGLTDQHVLKFMDAQDVLAKPEDEWTDEDRETLLDMLAIRQEMHP